MKSKKPKIIHYCWFGPNKKPASVFKYIDGWKDKLPDYKIIEWNETNFDINCCKYVEQAYAAKKFAFVADYARLKALYEFGGVYLDTDVEVVKSLNRLIEINEAEVILGFEEKNWVCTSTIIADKKNVFIKEFLDSYHTKSFLTDSGINTTTNVNILSNWLFRLGLKQQDQTQNISYQGSTIKVLEQQYLSPMDYINRIDNRTGKSYTVHHYDITWGKRKEYLIRLTKLAFVKLVGKNLASKFWGMIR